MTRAAHIQAYLEEIYSRQKDRFVLWAPVILGGGIGLYFACRVEPPFTGTLCAMAVAGLLAAGCVWARRDMGWRAFLPLAGGVLCLLVLGFTLAQWRTVRLDTVMLAKERRVLTIEGRIESMDWLQDGSGLRLILRDLVLEGIAPEDTPQKVRVRVRDGVGLRPGDRIRMRGSLSPPAAPVAPGAFDFQRYAYFQHIGAFGFSFDKPVVVQEAAAARSTCAVWLETLRQSIGMRMRQAMPPGSAPLAIALVNGEAASISKADYDAMRVSGLAHMISISGMHISIVAGLIFFVTRLLMAAIPPLALTHPIKKYAAVLAFAGALFYTFIAGAPIPTIRAMIMTGVILFAVMVDRVALSIRLVAIAAFVVLLIWPEALWGASFQMSFGAVVAMIVGYEAFKPWLAAYHSRAGIVGKCFLYFVGVCATTLVASLATAPFSLFHFQQLGIYSIPSNMMASPVMTFIVMPAAIVACLLMPLGLEYWPLQVMGKGVDLTLWIAHYFTALPQSSLTMPAVPLAVLLLVVGGSLVLLLWKGRGRFLGLLPMAVAIAIVALHQPPDILISANSKLIAVRGADGNLALSSRQRERFVGENWLRLNGQEGQPAGRWPAEGYDPETGLTCDEAACRWQKDGRKIAFSFHGGSHQADCAWADILISTRPVRVKPCPSPLVIDRFDTWRDGAYAVWLDGRYQMVRTLRGNRPWTVSQGR